VVARAGSRGELRECMMGYICESAKKKEVQAVQGVRYTVRGGCSSPED
jgi:hypothetical protein